MNFSFRQPARRFTRLTARQKSIRTLRAGAFGCVALVATVAGGDVSPSAAHANAVISTDVAREISLINETRARAGVAPLSVDVTLLQVANDWSARMAATSVLSHNVAAMPSKFNGENVGYASSVDAVHNLFLNSPGHYANLVNPAYHHVGVGVVVSGNRVFVTCDFLRG